MNHNHHNHKLSSYKKSNRNSKAAAALSTNLQEVLVERKSVRHYTYTTYKIHCTFPCYFGLELSNACDGNKLLLSTILDKLIKILLHSNFRLG
jgi:hypothetical protein